MLNSTLDGETGNFVLLEKSEPEQGRDIYPFSRSIVLQPPRVTRPILELQSLSSPTIFV